MAAALRPALVALVMLACPSFTAGQPAPPDPATAVIVGQVVDAASGRPVGGALVLLSGGPPLPRLPGTTVPPVRPRVMADSEGRFAFSGLSAGRYTLTTTKPGYVEGAHGRRRPGGLAQPLPIAAGEKASDITIAMWRHATVTGSVVDEAGEPVVGVEVRALRRTWSAGRRQFTAGPPSLRQVVTDNRGIYRISGLVPGEYVVVVVSAITAVPASILQGYRDAVQGGGTGSPDLFLPIYEAGSTGAMPGMPTALGHGDSVLSLQRMIAPPPVHGERVFVYPTTYYPSAFTAPEASVLTLGSGEERTAIDFQMRPVPTARVAGTVSSAAGAVTNVPITLSLGVGVADTETVAATLTDGRGGFVFPAVPVGQYTLRILKQPAAPDNRTFSMIQSGSGIAFGTTIVGSSGPSALPTEPALWATMPLGVGRSDVSNLAVMLQSGPRVTGRIEFEGTTEKPGPLTMVQLRFEGEAPRPQPIWMSTVASVPWQIRVDADGTFATQSVPGGKYFIRATGAPPGWSFKSATLNGRDVSEQPFELQSDATGVVITLTDTPIELSGVAKTPAGEPDAEATVVIFPTETQAWNSPAPGTRRFRAIRTGKNGAYTASGLPAGSYYVVAIPEASASDWLEPKYLEQLARLATDVRLDERDKRTLDLTTKEVR